MEHQVHGVLKLIQFDGLLVKSCRVSALKVGQITQKTHSLGKTTILFHYTCIPAVIRKMRNYKDLLCLVCIQWKPFPKEDQFWGDVVFYLGRDVNSRSYWIYNSLDILSKYHWIHKDSEKTKSPPLHCWQSIEVKHFTSELGLLSHKSLARSSPAVLLTACSNTSTFSISVRWS